MPMNKPMKKMPKKPMPKKGKIAAIAITCLALTGCAGFKSAKDLALNSFSTPKTAVECLQREQDKKNVGVTYDVLSTGYDAVAAVGWLAGASIIAPVVTPIEWAAGGEVGKLTKTIVRQISDQKDLACEEIEAAQ